MGHVWRDSQCWLNQRNGRNLRTGKLTGIIDNSGRMWQTTTQKQGGYDFTIWRMIDEIFKIIVSNF